MGIDYNQMEGGYDKFTRDDWGGQVINNGTNPDEVNDRQDMNGSTDKPFPQERNFVRDNNPNDGIIGGNHVPNADNGNVANHFGQVKYARREGATSIYKDETRNTENDNAASRKAEASTIYEAIGEDEESQGI